MFYFDRLKLYLILQEASKETGIPLINLLERIQS